MRLSQNAASSYVKIKICDQALVKRLLLLASLSSLLSLWSCGAAPASTAITCTTTTATTSSETSSSTCTDPVTAITITISPVTASVNVVSTQQFLAGVSGGTNNVITWQVNKVTGGNDMVGRIDSNGLYHAPSTAPASTVTVMAVSYEDPALSAASTVTILPSPTVTLASPPSLTVSSGTSNTLPFSATVTGAPTTNVTWLVNNLQGGNATFGTINSTGLYTAPATPPAGSKVTVTAASTDFPQSSASAIVTISGYSTSSFVGQFAFSLSGRTTAGPFFRAGSFTANGAGQLTNGLEDINDPLGVTPIPISFVGSYTIGVDGRGTLTFNDQRSTTPASFDFVLVNSTQLQIIGFDGSGTSSGQANLQIASTFTSTALSGPYVFEFAGVHGANTFSQIGEFTADGAGAITSGQLDINDGGVPAATQTISAGSYTVGSNGRGTLTLITLSATLHFSFYVVSRGSAKIVGTDTAQQVAGMTSQQSPNATFNNTSLRGNFAFLQTGTGLGGTLATAGSFSADGNGHITSGVLDENVSGTPATDVALSAGGIYAVSSTGRGTLTFSTPATATRPTAPTCNFVFYIGSTLATTGSAVFQEVDSTIASDGIFAQQESAAFLLASIQGNYAIASSGASGASSEVFTGQLSANGAGVIPAGAIDVNTAGTTTQGEAVTGVYSAPAASGRTTFTLNSSAGARNFAGYVVSPTEVFLIGIDPGRLAAGSLLLQF